jgi:hypothetical protein
MNNLLPVFQAACRRSWNPGILTGERVVIRSQDLNDLRNVVGVRDLMAATTLRERFEALVLARRHYRALWAAFSDQAMQREKISRRRTLILTELTLCTVVSQGLQRLYSQWEPSCVISTSDLWPFDHAVFREAHRSGVPSFVIQHGITNRYWWPFVADKLLLWGRPFEDELLKLGAPRERLAVCGMPAADHIFSRRQQNITSDREKTALRYVVLSDTHNQAQYPGLYAKFKVLFKTVLSAAPSTQWSIKLHPMEDDSFYRDMLHGNFPNLTILPKTATLEESVTQADVACTLWSTSGLEAMLMRRPLVVFDLVPLVQDYAWWPNRGGGTYVSTAGAMLDFVKRASSDGQFLTSLMTRQEQFLAETFVNPGQAADAVLDTVEEVVRIAQSWTGSGDQVDALGSGNGGSNRTTLI